jgi:predicted transcriptional regulator
MKNPPGRPRLLSGPAINVSLRLVQAELDSLDRLAKVHNVTRSYAARLALLQGLGIQQQQESQQ